MQYLWKNIIVAAVASIIINPAMAQDNDDTPNPYLMPNESWISISGTAVAPGADSFTLDYGEGTVLVEMDDWDWYGDAAGILDGDKVTVYGEVDDDLYETTSIEASSVYVESLGTYFYASAADEEDYGYYNYWIAPTLIEVGEMTVRGTVSSVAGREFTIDTGPRMLTVDTIAMPYNPLDDKGFQQIDKGDYVSVSGDLDYNVWAGRELTADHIITISED